MARFPTTASSWRRLVARLHLWVGLVPGVPLVLLGLSGSILAVNDELSRIFDPPSQVATEGAPRPVSEIVAAAHAAVPPGFAPSFYLAPDAPGEPASVRFVPASREASGPGGLRVEVDPVSLQVVADRPSGKFVGTLHAFHAALFLQDRKVVGWLGVAMLALGISGIINWWPRPHRWRAAFTVKRGARGLRLHRDLHGAVGIWTLLTLVAVSLSGVYLAFPATVRSGLDLVLPVRDLRAAAASVRVAPIPNAAPLSTDEAVALARAEFPSARVVSVALAVRPTQPIRVGLLRPGQDRGAPVVTAFVDPWARRVVKVLDPRDYTFGETILAWQHALHSGRGLGGLWQVLVFLSGLLPLLFAVTGTSMWWLKRQRRRPAATSHGSDPDQLSPARRAAE